MLTVLIAYLIIFCCCVSCGVLLYRIPVWRTLSDHDSITSVFLSGLVALTLVTQVACLFTPIDLSFQLVLLALLGAGCCWQRMAVVLFIKKVVRRLRHASFPMWAGGLLLLIMVAVVNAGPVMSDDTESYHIQMVKWLKEYGTVPGLVHLHSRFGFNSAWFSSIALFNVRVDHFNYFTVLNGVTGLLLMLFLWVRVCRLVNDNPWLQAAAGLVLVFCLYSWPLFRGNATTSSYDHITTAMIVVMAFRIMCAFENSLVTDAGVSLPLVEMALWPVFLFTVRIMNFPLLAVSLYVIIFLFRNHKRGAWLVLAISALMVISFLSRNLLLTGYLFYPLMSFDLFPVDWKADPVATAELMDFIRQFNKVATQYQAPDVTRPMGMSQWVPLWFRHLFTYDRLLLCTSLLAVGISLLLLGYRPWRRAVVQKTGKMTDRYATNINKAVFNPGTVALVFGAALSLQLLVWFLVAPDPRFVYGPLLCGVALPAFLLMLLKSGRQQTGGIRTMIRLTTLLGILAFAIFTISRDDSAYLETNLVMPAKFPSPELSRQMIGRVAAQRPAAVLHNWNPRCYDTDLPCIYEIDPRTIQRGPFIQNGFRLKRQTE